MKFLEKLDYYLMKGLRYVIGIPIAIAVAVVFVVLVTIHWVTEQALNYFFGR